MYYFLIQFIDADKVYISRSLILLYKNDLIHLDMKKISLKAFLNKRWIRVTAFQGHVFGGMLIFFPNHAIEVLLKAMSCIVPLYIRSYFSQLFKMSKVVSKKRTRSGTTDILVGEPCQLSENVLPTVLDIGRALLYHQLEMTAKFNTTIGSPINVKFNLFRDIVAEKNHFSVAKGIYSSY